MAMRLSRPLPPDSFRLVRHSLVVLSAAGTIFVSSLSLSAPAYAGTYTVRAGDTLWGISSRYGVSVAELQAANKLPGDLLQIGQTLTIPGQAAPSPAPKPAPAPVPATTGTYTVKAGDTLWGIAQAYHTTTAAIMSANGLTSDFLHIGQKLTLPGAPVDAGQAVRTQDAGTLTAPASRGATDTRDLFAFADNYLGKPYVWGASGPNGFDCSGFTSFVFKHVGISLSHSSYEQYKQGVAVSRDQLQPGDLVFFRTYSAGASHVGIYAGEGRFIHASSSKGITYTNLSDSWYAPRYLGARRVL